MPYCIIIRTCDVEDTMLDYFRLLGPIAVEKGKNLTTVFYHDYEIHKAIEEALLKKFCKLKRGFNFFMFKGD